MTITKRLARTTPESQGIPSIAILDYLDAVKSAGQELHSFMLLRKGSVVAEAWWPPYGPEVPHMLYSLSKSFTSSAAGLAISEGHFTLDDPVLKFFPDDKPDNVSANLAAMEIRHLLTMSTGHDQDATGDSCSHPDGNWARGFLSLPVDHVPGTHFVYNSAATYMIAAIVEKVTGMGLLEYLQPRLMGPLGIIGATWETCPRGIAAGGWGLDIRTEDIACFGQLYLQKGVWNGKRILSEHWVAEATSRQVDNGSDANSDWAQGYGYQFWRSRQNAYRGDGAFGQYCIVMPEQEAVAAITSGIGDMQAALNMVWKHLLPAMGSEPVQEDYAAQELLQARLSNLQIAVPEGEIVSTLCSEVTGKTYRFTENDLKIESVSFSMKVDRIDIRIQDADGNHNLECGIGAWVSGVTTFLLSRVQRRSVTNPDWKTAAYGIWTSPNILTVKLCFYETPFTPTMTFHFSEIGLKLDLRGSISFGPSEWLSLEGRHSN